AAVKQHLGRPALFVNDKVEAPAFYSLTHAYGGRWSWEEVAQRNIKIFCNSGTSLYQVDMYLEDIWYKDADTLDMAKVQRQVKGVLDACPNAGVVIRIHVNAPFWWNEKNPEECTKYADGPIEQRTYGVPFNNEDGDVDRALRASLASMKWRKEAGEKLKQFCKRLYNTPEGNSVLGFHVRGGIYGEWHYWGFIPHDPDTGPAMTAYFREWLKKKYKTDKNLQSSWRTKAFTLNNATVPGKEERIFTADSIFHDPAKEQRVIDYFIAQQEVVAEDIEYFCKIVKDNWRRPNIVGVFYGYFHMTFCRQATGGHLFIERILNSPHIDYLAAPQTYWGDSRRVGGSGNSRGIIESTLLHGKLWLDEMDNGGEQKNYQADLRASFEPSLEYASLIRRNSLLPMMRGIGLWYYDFGVRFGQGWWDRPLYQQQIAEEKKLFDEWAKQKQHSVADVLVVWSMESFYYVKNVWYPLCYDQLDAAAEELLRAGAATDHIYIFDIDRVNLDQYKAVVFMNTYMMSSGERLLIKNKVAKNNRTLIFNYLPGYTDGSKLDVKWVTQVTGMKLQKLVLNDTPVVEVKDMNIRYQFAAPVHPLYVINDPATETVGLLRPKNSNKEYPIIARKKLGDHTVVHAMLPVHNPSFFRKLFADAGCHIYNSEPDFTYANSNALMLHTKEGGEKQLRLRNGKVVQITVPKTSTWLLDATTGEVLLPLKGKSEH
ncbi:MAG TPA: hypothetical protein VEZ55_08035, partial [Chitinophagaceae bacterium]|nr:hypothetical protein [Chitinophagaceae bacterium]